MRVKLCKQTKTVEKLLKQEYGKKEWEDSRFPFCFRRKGWPNNQPKIKNSFLSTHDSTNFISINNINYHLAHKWYIFMLLFARRDACWQINQKPLFLANEINKGEWSPFMMELGDCPIPPAVLTPDVMNLFLAGINNTFYGGYCF